MQNNCNSCELLRIDIKWKSTVNNSKRCYVPRMQTFRDNLIKTQSFCFNKYNCIFRMGLTRYLLKKKHDQQTKLINLQIQHNKLISVFNSKTIQLLRVDKRPQHIDTATSGVCSSSEAGNGNKIFYLRFKIVIMMTSIAVRSFQCSVKENLKYNII